MFDGVEDLATGPAGYLIIALIVALDAFFPAVPGETAVITGGILAAQGELSLPLVLAAALVGAVIGDNISYALGATFGERVVSLLFRGEKAQQRCTWAVRNLRERGRLILLVARFIPGGRTAATFTCGALGLGWRRFLVVDATAAAVWAAYATALGALGGEAFEDSGAKALIVALLTAGAIAAAGELVHRRRHGQRDAEPVEPDRICLGKRERALAELER